MIAHPLKLARNIGVGAVLLAIAAALGVYAWFWGAPVGVNNMLNKVMLELSFTSPQRLTELGFLDGTIVDFHSDNLDDFTEAGDAQEEALLMRAKSRIERALKHNRSPKDVLSLRLSEWVTDDLLRQIDYPHAPYRLTHWAGPTVDIPKFLTEIHAVRDSKSAERYVARARDFTRVLKETEARVVADAQNGIVPPDFIIERSIASMEGFLEGGVENNLLTTTLAEELEAIALETGAKEQLLDELSSILTNEIFPSYQTLIALYTNLLTDASHAPGIWRLPNGAAHYQALLQSHTTTTLSAHEIHDLGLKEVALTKSALNTELDALGVPPGPLAERLDAFTQSANDSFEMTDDGRAAMMSYLQGLNIRLQNAMACCFENAPEAPFQIVRMPPAQEALGSAGRYSPPSLDGKRQGRFLVNQKDGTPIHRWRLPTLFAHEAIPGHHLQVAYAQAEKDLPLVRRFWFSPAYGEGWALYAERIAAEELGLYDNDRAGKIGYLTSDLFRAARLVVDTGIHEKRWSREQAIAYLAESGGISAEKAKSEVDRYSVYPGQAASYKIGLLAMLSLRDRAQSCLGDAFSYSEFHDIILSNGPLPLTMLEATFEDWLQKKTIKADQSASCRANAKAPA